MAKPRELRCPGCASPTRPGQLLLRAEVVRGEIKCPRCGALLKIEYSGGGSSRISVLKARK